MSKFTQYTRVTALNAAGEVIAVSTNQPMVRDDGILKQEPLGTIVGMFAQYGVATEIADMKIEHLPLEGDYEVWADPKHLTDMGLRYSLAAALNWIDPITKTKIIRSDGDLFVKGNIDIMNLNGSYQRFDPWENKALLAEILFGFKVSVRFDHMGLSTFSTSNSGGKWYDDNDYEEFVRTLCIHALYNRMVRRDDNKEFRGHVPLSMVKIVDDKPKEVDTAPDTGLAP